MGQRADCGTVCARTSKANATGGDVVRGRGHGSLNTRGKATGAEQGRQGWRYLCLRGARYMYTKLSRGAERSDGGTSKARRGKGVYKCVQAT